MWSTDKASKGKRTTRVYTCGTFFFFSASLSFASFRTPEFCFFDCVFAFYLLCFISNFKYILFVVVVLLKPLSLCCRSGVKKNLCVYLSYPFLRCLHVFISIELTRFVLHRFLHLLLETHFLFRFQTAAQGSTQTQRKEWKRHTAAISRASKKRYFFFLWLILATFSFINQNVWCGREERILLFTI